MKAMMSVGWTAARLLRSAACASESKRFHWQVQCIFGGQLFVIVAAFLAIAAVAAGQGIQPRQPLIKPEHIVVDPAIHETHVIIVKFHDDLPIRLRGGRLTDLDAPEDERVLGDAQAILDAFGPPIGTWQRITDAVTEERIDEMRAEAQQNLGRALADMNTYFHLLLPPQMNAADVINLLNTLDVVELASPVPLPAPPPCEVPSPSPGCAPPETTPPNFQPCQGYLNAAPDGIDAYFGWSSLDTRGEGVQIVDIEQNFNPTHLDLPDVTILGGLPQSSSDHGTAVLGVLGSIANGWGTTGIAHESPLYFASTTASGFSNVAGAVLVSADALEAGDVILIEAQTGGPNGFVPVEWVPGSYHAIQVAVGTGRIVVAAAGNGNQDLDDPIYSEGNFGHWPFLPENDSGSIMVGGGHAPAAFGGTGVDRSRMTFSNYGSRVNVQGWGQAVTTTGGGGAFSQCGPDLHYRKHFSGTSSASPIVTGAAALLQSAHKNVHGTIVSPLIMRQALMDTGSPQQDGANPAWQNIGPRPNVAAAAGYLGLLGVDQPTIAVLPGTLAPMSFAGQSAAAQELQVWTVGGGTLEYVITTNEPWLSVSPAHGTSSGEMNNHTVSYSMLPLGEYNAVITIQASGATNTPVTVPVSLAVLTAPSAYWDNAVGQPGMNATVHALTVFDDGTGEALYAGGDFTLAGGQPASRIAMWDGSSWSPLGSGLNGSVRALTVFDDGTGEALYAGGDFMSAGGNSARSVAKWDGSSWSALGSGINGSVRALTVFDDGTGAALYAGGAFTSAGGQQANRIAKWDGSSWAAVGSGVNHNVSALAVFDDDEDEALYLGGRFTGAGGKNANFVVKWDGSSWSPLGSGTSSTVEALAVHDDGSGPALYAGGLFTFAGEVAANRVARWDGSSWSAVGAGVDGTVLALNPFDDGTGPALYAGGSLTTAGGEPANRIAAARPCGLGDIDCDGVVGVFDLLLLLSAWGECADCTPGSCPADLDDDCVVGVFDLLIVLANWG